MMISTAHRPEFTQVLEANQNNETFMKMQMAMIGVVLFVSGYILIKITLIITILFVRFISMNIGQRHKANQKLSVLITGATSGLGLCLAKHLHKLGFTVFAGYFSQLEPGFEELNEIIRQEASDNRRLFLVPLDVSSQDSIDKCYEFVESNLNENDAKLHAVVNNAGCSFDGPFEWSDRSCIKRVIDTNMIGCIMVSRKFIKRIIIDKGRLVNVSSGIEVVPTPSMSIYGSTKSAVAYFSSAVHADLMPYGASSCCILPGNLITSTNIMFTRLRGLQDSVSRLDDEEKRLYSSSIERAFKLHDALVMQRLKKTGYEIEDAERMFSVNLDRIRDARLRVGSSKSTNCNSASLSVFLRRSMHKFISLMSGEARAKNIEESGALIAFEAAILLKDVPRRIYLGSWWYTYIAGPLADLLPPAIYGLAIYPAFKSFSSAAKLKNAKKR